MKFLSASDSFVERTLTALPAPLARLAYLGRLRAGSGYEHWGMSNEYGADAANQAIAEAHHEIWMQILRTPVHSLVEQLREMSPAAGTADLVRQWQHEVSRLVPADIRGGTRRHFNSILLALSLLSRADTASSRRAA